MKLSDLRVFKESEKSRKHYNFIVFSIIAYLMAIVGSLVGEIPGMILGAGMPKYLSTVIFTMWIGFGMMIVLPVLHVKFVEKRPIRGLGFYKEGMFGQYLIGALVGIGFMAAVVLLGMGLGVYKLSLNDITMAGLKMIFVMLLGFVVQGAAEEILVRGWMLPLLSNKYGVAWGIILSSVFFAAFHAMNPGMTVIPVVNLILVGIFLALYYIKEQNLWGVFGFHSFWNWAQGNLFGIKVSGNAFPGGSVFSTEVSGIDILSGGSFGAEGSLLCSLVLVIGIIYFFNKLKKDYTFE